MELHNLASLTQNLNMTRLFRGVALEPPAPIDLLAWAEAHVVFDDGPFQGPYNRNLFPFFDEILRALSSEDPCRYVSVMSSAQVGKTTLGNIFCLASITLRNGSFLVAHPTSDSGREMVKDEARADDAVNPGRERVISAARQ